MLLMPFNQKQMVHEKMMKDGHKTRISRLNPPTLKNEVMIHKTQSNSIISSSLTVLRSPKQQSPTNAKRNTTNVKLPTIAKKTSPKNVKPTLSPYIQTSPQRLVSTSTVVTEPLPPKLLNPVVMTPDLPSIKNHVIQANLTLKATLRCKTPRPQSVYSRSNTILVNELEEPKKTHPLQNMDVGSLLSESARTRLTRLFKRLDTDQDGHLLYPQVQRCLPPNLLRAQLTFFRVLYDIISNATFFGLQEFFATAVIVDMIAQQNSTLWNTYLDDVDFNYYHDQITELLEEFNNQCTSTKSTINYENLLQLIIKSTTKDKTERITNQLEYLMPKIKTMKINRLDFIALLPAIIYIQSSFEQGRTLFRFKENSLLDFHMRQALLTENKIC